MTNNRNHAAEPHTATMTAPAPPTGHVHWQCDICGIVMLDLHCKLRCTNCGFMRDCSDP